MPHDTAPTRAQLFLALARAMELATGATEDFALRGLVLSMRLADAAGLPPADRRAVFDHSLLRFIGCNAETHLYSAFVEDEITFRRDIATADLRNPAEVLPILLRRLRPGPQGPRSLAALMAAVARAMEIVPGVLEGHCDVAARLGERLGLAAEASRGLGQLYARWDGRGTPSGLAGSSIAVAARVVILAQETLAIHDLLGREGVVDRLRRRSGKAYDPALASLVLARTDSLLMGLDHPPRAEVALAMEPPPPALAEDEAVEAAFLVIADIVDLRLPSGHGHSRAVADLCAHAAQRLNLPSADRRDLHLAALAHDLGELAVPVGAWVRPSGLTRNEAETARQHPRIGAHLLSSLAEALPGVVALVQQHHERLDGSGTPYGLRGTDLSLSARILQAAEALVSGATPTAMRTGIAAGVFCPTGAEAVLEAAGAPGRRAAPPPGLTAREIEVLQCLCAGLTTKAAARQLGISPKTCDHHIQSLYGKTGVQTRAGVVLWAMERGLSRPG